MRMLEINKYTELDELQISEGPSPTPQNGELLVRVAAVGVNPLDWKLITGSLKDFFPLSFPFIPGREGSGIVEAIGTGVTGFSKGDRVYGRALKMVAEYATMKVDDVALVPKNINLLEAASIPTGAQNAYSILHETIKIRPGQKILIHGASGGVGLYAVQLAALAGAEVWATTSSANVEMVRLAGAYHVIDYKIQNFEEMAHEMDFVLNTVNDDLENRSWSVLRDNGVLISLLRSPILPEEAQKQNKKGIFLNLQPDSASIMPIINQLVSASKIYPTIDEVFTLENVDKAYIKSRNGHVRGKILININSNLT